MQIHISILGSALAQGAMLAVLMLGAWEIENVEAEHATEGVFRQTGPVWAGTTRPDGRYQVREGSVTDTADLLAEAGYTRPTIDELLENGVIA